MLMYIGVALSIVGALVESSLKVGRQWLDA